MQAPVVPEGPQTDNDAGDPRKTRALAIVEESAKLANNFLLSRESDRAAAVLGAAYLDGLVTELLRTVLLPGNGHTRLFGRDGPLQPFGARVHLCEALGLLTSAAIDDLRIIGKIRNRFAHDGRCTTSRSRPSRSVPRAPHLGRSRH